MRIIKGHKYRYNPVPIDVIFPTYGIRQGLLKSGDIVKVIAPPGMPKEKTINANHVYIETEIDGKWLFVGMIHINSLEKI